MKRFYTILYETLGMMLAMILVLVHWKKLKPGTNMPGAWKERFGIYPSSLSSQKTIWFHAVSIGEILSILPLLIELKKRFPAKRVLLTCTTVSGKTIAMERIPEVEIRFFPFDLSFCMKRAIKSLRPELFIAVETEFWPILMHTLSQKKIPAILLNGRISKTSFNRYRLLPGFTRETVRAFSSMVMKSTLDASRAIQLGAIPEKVSISKSMKFDRAWELSQQTRECPFSSKEPVIILGSLHLQEEEAAVAMIEDLSLRFPTASFILAPRSLLKTRLATYLQKSALSWVRKTEWDSTPFQVLLLDTFGELTDFYACADIAFVGGSIAPGGGHNPLEPLAFNKVVLYGPCQWDFEREWSLIKEAGAGIEVRNFPHLTETITNLLLNPATMQKIGSKGIETISLHRGATEENLKRIEKYITLQ
jgi:3-deoxy-D-manno-octulosonic-acid transferase